MRNGSSASPTSGTRPITVVDIPHAAPSSRSSRPVEVTRELTGALERVRDGLRPDVRIAVEVAADPGAEAQRLAGAREPLDQGALELGDRVPEALLEEPQPLADLVDDPRPLGADLVGLPEQRDLLGEGVLEPPPLGERRALVVEAGEERGDPPVRLEDRAARRLGRMGGEDELDPEPLSCRLDLGLVDPAPVELRERIGKRLARHPSLGLVLAAPADPVVLLGDVDELEEQRERPQHGALALRAERGDRVGERLPWAAGARIAGEGADPLLVVEQILAFLLDEHLPEQIAEEADVGTEGGIGRHPRSVVGHDARLAEPTATRRPRRIG